MRWCFGKICLIIIAGIIFSGCDRDVNLADDVDLLMQASPTPFMAQNSPRQIMPQQPTQKVPTPQTTKAPTNSEPATVSATQADIQVDLTVTFGTIRIKLLPNAAPNTVKNFLSKIRSGFYSGLTFHRVENWVIQGGDPEGSGRGGGSMPTELSQVPFREGSVGVARGGDIMVSNDSQFFICTTDCSWLTGQYTIFGEVISGMDVAKQVTMGTKIDNISEVIE